MFGRKKNRSRSDKSAPPASEEGGGFYDSQPTEAPLNAPPTAPPPGARGRRSSSIDSPVRRRENDTRTSNRDLFLLVLKIASIPVLLLVGYLVLKLVVAPFDEPSEEEMQQSKERAALMDQAPAAEDSPDADATTERVVSAEELADRLTGWEKAERHVRAAEGLELRGIDDDAVVRLRQALQFAPESREAQRRLLNLYMDSEKYAEAIPLCIRLLDQDSTQREVKLLLLHALQKEQKSELCVLLAGQLLQKHPRDTELLELAAYNHAITGETDKALDYYKRILEENPKNLLALEGAGTIYQQQREWEEAVPYYLELLERNPIEEHYLALAQCYSQLGDSGEAALILGQAYELYGVPVVSPWLLSPAFDPIRETADFRSFADIVVGERRRLAIEKIRRRETGQGTFQGGGQIERALDRLAPQDLNILKPHRNRQRPLRRLNEQ